jgi:holo-[acyl-carrier protein] synthase
MSMDVKSMVSESLIGGGNVVGTGIDVIEISRISQAMDRWGERFLRRIYTPREIRYCQARRRPELSFAARFAAKEAAMKALGMGPRGGVPWKSLEVVNLPTGAPIMRSGPGIEPLLNGRTLLISLTHTRQQAMAMALLIDRPGEES